MKKFIIQTFLRPALFNDIFEVTEFLTDDPPKIGRIFSDKQFFYQEKDGSFYGPHRIISKEVKFAPHAMPKKELGAYLQKREQWFQEEDAQRIEIYSLLAQKRIFIVDQKQYLESVKIHLKVKLAEPHDLLQNKTLLVNTAYFQKKEDRLEGPFFITEQHTTKDFKSLIATKNMFVFDVATKIEPIKIEIVTTAEAV